MSSKSFFIDDPLMKNNNKKIKIIQKQEKQHVYFINKITTKHYRITYVGILIIVDSVPQKRFTDSIFVLGNCSDNLKITCNIVHITFEIKGL